MQRQSKLITVLAVTLFAAPIASATWYGHGTYEPDTERDVLDGYMQIDRDVNSTAKKLYFNAYSTEYPTSTNPNSGTAGSRILTPGLRQYGVMMGPWKDCNGDNYVGLAETAIVVYRNELLLDKSICPVGSFHNDGQWVWEYVPVGYQYESAPSVHPRQIVDPQSRVWGDIGLPGAAAAQTCPIIPLPHGTTAGTGWAIRYADCHASRRITGTVNQNDPTGMLAFSDPNNPQYSGSLLNRHFPESLFGNPATGETGTLQLDSDEDDHDYDPSNPQGSQPDYAFTMWDCSSRTYEVKDPTGLAPRTVSVDDPTYNGQTGSLGGNYGKVDENLTDSNGNYAWFAGADPNPRDPRASVADGLNETFRGFRVGGGDENWDSTAIGGDCDEVGDDNDGDNTYAGAHQLAFFYADGSHEGNTQAPAKNKADIRFTYSNGAENDGALGQQFGTSTPQGLGLQAAGTGGLVLVLNHGWNANSVYATTPQSVDRNTLQPQGALYFTFYGRVGQTTLDQWKPYANTPGTYGFEACGANTSGIHGGWECASAKWYRDSNNNDISQPLWDVRVGTSYHFRDVDCADGAVVRGSGVHASLVDVIGDSCTDAP